MPQAVFFQHETEVREAAPARQERHRIRAVPSKRVFLFEGRSLTVAKRVVEGWAATFHDFEDGRRQLLALTLPGEIIGGRGVRNGQSYPMMAIGRLILADLAPDDDGDSHVCDCERYHFNQIIRLGRLNAYERIAHFFVEIAERLGVLRRSPTGIDFPINQEQLGDLLGLTPVHVNRTLQQMRRDRVIELSRRRLELLAPEELVAISSYGLATSQRTALD